MGHPDTAMEEAVRSPKSLVDGLQTRFFVVDAFTSTRFPELKGNPAGVLIKSAPLKDDLAVQIAKQINLGLPALATISDADLFTKAEYPFQHAALPIAWLGPAGHFLPMCGHATMATTLVLLNMFPSLQEVTFVARSGKRITAARTKSGASIALPALPRPESIELCTRGEILRVLQEACNLEEKAVLFMGESRASDGTQPNLLAELDASVDLQSLKVNTGAIATLPYRGLWLVGPGPSGNESVNMQTRVFFPRVGLPEDHVCGSAHTLFTPFWASKKPEYLIGDHDVELVSRQVSPRGGLLDLRWNKEWGDQEGMCWLTGEGLIQDLGSLNI